MRIQVGDLHLLIEPETGFLRQVRLGSTPLVNAIYFAIREANWATAQATWTLAKRSVEGERFTVELTGTASHGTWTTVINGTSSGVHYGVRFVAARSFRTARTGLCLLHPREHAGAQATAVSNLGGRPCRRSLRLPTLISPHQPLTELAELQIELPAADLAFQFSGQTFEMEDQRNWGDASFKTYCRSNHLGAFEIKEGEVVEQSIAVTIIPKSPAKPLLTKVGDLAWTMERPVEVVGESAPFPVLASARFHVASPPAWTEEALVDFASGIPRKTGATVMVPPQNGEPSFWDRLCALAAPSEVGILMRSNFTELNRLRPWLHRVGTVGWEFNPTVHMADARSVLETPATLDDQVESARKSLGASGCHVRIQLPSLPQPLVRTWLAAMLARGLSCRGLASITFPNVEDAAWGQLVLWTTQQGTAGRAEVLGPVYACHFAGSKSEGLLLVGGDLDVGTIDFATRYQGMTGTLVSESGAQPVTLGARWTAPTGPWFLFANRP